MTVTTQESTTPETDRMNAYAPVARMIDTFLSWAARQGYILVRPHESSDTAFGGGTVWVQEVDEARLNKLLAQHFGIDLSKVAAERDALAEEQPGKATYA